MGETIPPPSGSVVEIVSEINELTQLQKDIAKAVELQKCDIEGAIIVYRSIIDCVKPKTSSDEDTAALIDSDRKVQEQAVYRLGEILVETGRTDALKSLFVEVRPFFDAIPKARTARIVRTLLDLVKPTESNRNIQEELCLECIEWCRREKRTFLRHRIETRLALLYYTEGKFPQAMHVLTSLLYEVKKLDDKLLLVEIHLLESKVFFSVKNFAKAKAALTASRTSANAINCPPLLQADIDLQSGVLHAEEKDHQTAYSYFYEAFEALNVADDPRAMKALKYMLLAKIMCDQPSEVTAISTEKRAIPYAGKDIDALNSVAKSHRQRSLKMFESTLDEYSKELRDDEIIQRHISDLHETLLEQNLLRILEPYERVEIEHITKLIDLPITRVLSKTAEMILDKKLDATLDQGIGVLILFDRPPLSDLYKNVLQTFANVSLVVDTLHRKAQIASP